MNAFQQFYIEFKSIDGNTLHSHSSLMDEEKAMKVKEIHKQFHFHRNGLSFLAGYLSLEAVNRVPQLLCKPLYQRAGLVIGSTLLVHQLVEPVYWYISGNAQLQKQMVGEPVYKNKRDVVELDKAFFFLDDDNNYAPSLMHHGTSSLSRNFTLYTNEPTSKQ